MPEGAPSSETKGTAVPAPTKAMPPRIVPRGGVLVGIGLVTVSFAAFALQDAIVKWVVADYSTWQVLFTRSAVIVVICLTIGRRRLVLHSVRSPIRNTLLARAIGLLLAWLSFYTAAKSLQLAELTTIYFASPLLVAILAVPILGETVSRMRWASILIGFTGVLIACRPGDFSHATAIGLALLAAVFWAGSMILIRQVALREPTSVQMLTSSFAFILMTGVALPWTWKTPDLWDGTLMVGIGCLGACAQYLLIEGIRRAPASVVSPLEFTALVWAFVLGYLIWGDVPGLHVFGGAALILVSGAFIVFEEWRKARAPAVAI
jgi:drug/metabolite transporter (DMT)-like permease